MKLDRVVMVDWTGGADTGPTPRKDAIWLGQSEGALDHPPEYLRNRLLARDRLTEFIEDSLSQNQRLLIGFDFPFGYPSGFSKAVTGSADPLALWSWLAEQPLDLKDGRDRWDLAARINGLFPGEGPFWFNGTQRDIPGLPSKKPAKPPLPEFRSAESRAKGTFSCWQLGGAGAVGSQTLMGLPILEHLRQRFPDQISVWPFQPLDRPVIFAEIWPSLIAQEIARAQAPEEIKDAAQVRVLAGAIARLSPTELAGILDAPATDEGWILGLGQETVLAAAARQSRLKNDCFALPPGTEWTPVDQALSHLKSRLIPVVSAQTAPLAEAGGRYLAQEITALRSHPPAANAAVDGYGFAGGLGPGMHHLPLALGRAAAGAPFDGNVPPGHALRILTGAIIPNGVDTVVMEEDVRLGQGEITLQGPLKPKSNTRPAGEDVAEGEAIFSAGHRLTAPDLALLSATGVSRIQTFRRLRVAVLSTGDEVQDPGTALAPGQIADANRPMLLEVIKTWGFEAVDLGIARDTPDAVAHALTQGAAQADVILTSGGASAGDEDHLSRLLSDTGSMALWRIAVKPGRPLALGLWQGVPVFGLPGNPVAALVCTLVFARPALVQMAGGPWIDPLALTVPAAFRKSKKAGRREYLRARLEDGAAQVYPSEGSGRIKGLSWADGLVELPDAAATIEPGSPVRYLPFAGFGL